MSGARTARSAAAGLALGVLVLALAACGMMNKEDLRYRDSRLLPALTVPEGVAAPTYSSTMEIPAAGTPGPIEGDIELPPDLRGGDTGAGTASAQDSTGETPGESTGDSPAQSGVADSGGL
ncbi:MAG: hypothetical protein IPM20_06855 [Gammaproteobacteria bacterium]|nr:hypothetical protein [Gammaproteobacteria bacterium]